MAIKPISEFTEFSAADAADYFLMWSVAAGAHRKIEKNHIFNDESDVGFGTNSPQTNYHFKRTTGVNRLTVETDDTSAGLIIDYANGDGGIQFAKAGTGIFVMGVDDSDAQKFKLGHATGLVPSGLTTPALTIHSDNMMQTGAYLGVQVDPVSRLHVYEDNTGTGVETGLTVEQDGSGDALLHFLLTATRRWTMGVDNSDGDKLKIVSTTGTPNLGTSPLFTLDTSGNLTIAGTISGMGYSGGSGSFSSLTASANLSVAGNADITGNLSVGGSAAVEGALTVEPASGYLTNAIKVGDGRATLLMNTVSGVSTTDVTLWTSSGITAVSVTGFYQITDGTDTGGGMFTVASGGTADVTVGADTYRFTLTVGGVLKVRRTAGSGTGNVSVLFFAI